MKRSKFWGWLDWKILGSLMILGIMVYLPLRIALTRLQVPDPQGILILGGDPQRIEFGAELAARKPNLPIWLTGYSQEHSGFEGYFDRLNIAPDRLHYDLCATDTVTDFTCTVDDLSRYQIRHVYLITSDYHLPRATAIAWWVLGSRGIIVTPYSVPCLRGREVCGDLSESRWRILRDQIRSIVWVLTGRSGASLNPRFLSHLNLRP
jgi:uncharacterized SAM-binding protein YcdF (DUF218 family)